MMKVYTVYYSWQFHGAEQASCVDVVATDEEEACLRARKTVPGDEIVIEKVEEI
jgi:hypothetical protein